MVNQDILKQDEVIRERNIELSKETTQLSILNYTRLINSEFFPNYIDKQKIDVMIGICSVKGISIRYDVLKDLGILSKTADVSHVYELMSRHKLIEDVDWQIKLENVDGSQRASKVHYLSAHATLMCLGRNKHTDEYMKIYTFVFCIANVYYADYQHKFETHKMIVEHQNSTTALITEFNGEKSSLNDTIARLEKRLDESIAATNKSYNLLEAAASESKVSQEKIDQLCGRVETLNVKADQLQITADENNNNTKIVVEALQHTVNNVVLPAPNPEDWEVVLLFKKTRNLKVTNTRTKRIVGEFQYYISTPKIRTADRTISDLQKLYGAELLERIDVKDSHNIWDHCKGYRGVMFESHYNHIKFIGGTNEPRIRQLLHEVVDERSEITPEAQTVIDTLAQQ